MIVKRIARPWVRKRSASRLNPDPFYQSLLWKRTRKSFINSETLLPDGRWVSNRICLECFKKGFIRNGHSIDHIIRIKDGGDKTDFSNLQNLCSSCHAKKSAEEGLAQKLKNNSGRKV